MTSGEWDLRALKALEEEEQREFLALSQRNLFEPLPSDGGGAGAGAGGGGGGAKPALTYAQLHPHLLKLPTIDECQLIAAKQQSVGSSGNGHGSLSGLRFTRALSLSAHSLSPRGGGGGVGGGGGFGKKLRARLVGAKSSGSLSPSRHSHSYSVSPVYTPPPMRRCATLHHTQPVRKTFKNLQQLQDRKRQASQNAAPPMPLPGQLQRITGTGKTYWKYGANSTAASIIGQRTRRQQQHGTEPPVESNAASDLELNAEQLEADVLDSATETGSCSVPLPAADTNEVLRLMLSAASSAVTVTPTAAAAAAATGGTMSGPATVSVPAAATLRRYQAIGDVVEETVAYEAFHKPKSFERGALLRAGSLTVEESNSNSPRNSPGRAMQSTLSGGRRIFKSASLDWPGEPQTQTQTPPQAQQQQQINGLTTNPLEIVDQQTMEARYKQREWEHMHQHHQSHHQQQPDAALGLGMAMPGGHTIMDDELEQHIKHCSCSCNHMGYGNSMDYQVSGG